DYTAVTVSIDPRETPAMAAAAREGYVARTGLRDAAGGWRFLTGDAASIEWLAASVGFRYAFDEKSDQFAHASGVMILTPEGRLSRYLLGIEFAPKDLRLALVEASAGKIGSVRDRLLLLCFKYDPATGRYGAVAYTLVRAGGVLTVACLAVFLVIMLRRDARRARRDSAGPGVAAGRRA
ncbi:MAG TPA: SCO family protein, partial [Candidatus Polarisedimenticolia bacterium]|nr:SCO family protein [Candidatus Polarisedimenticolia bacterium]